MSLTRYRDRIRVKVGPFVLTFFRSHVRIHRESAR